MIMMTVKKNVPNVTLYSTEVNFFSVQKFELLSINAYRRCFEWGANFFV
jgi:hypothetical protein